MAFESKSEMTGALGEHIAQGYVMNNGWRTITGNRDAKYDFVVQMDGNKLETVQVKTFTGNQFAKIVDRSGERLSHNGKTRNSTEYAEHGIDWLVGVTVKDDK